MLDNSPRQSDSQLVPARPGSAVLLPTEVYAACYNFSSMRHFMTRLCDCDHNAGCSMSSQDKISPCKFTTIIGMTRESVRAALWLNRKSLSTDDEGPGLKTACSRYIRRETLVSHFVHPTRNGYLAFFRFGEGKGG